MSNPLRHEHLLAACDWAEGTGAAQPRLDNYKYDQETWDCGTACCLHGAAHLIATGEPTEYGPSEDDYRDLPPQIRAGVLMTLQNSKGTPELLRRVLTGEVVVPNPDCDPNFFDEVDLNKLVVIDVETTGLNPFRHQIAGWLSLS